MAEPLFDPDDYSTFIPPPSTTMAQIYGNVTKKNRNSTDPIGFVVNKYEQQQKNYELNNPIIDDIDTWYETNAPEFFYYEKTDPNSFERQVVNIIIEKDATPATINAGVQGLIDGGIYTGDPSNTLSAFAFAKNLYQEYTGATKSGLKQYDNRFALSPIGKLGLPDPEEDYNPLNFNNYVKWETGKIASFKKAFGDKFTPELQKKVESIYRNRSVSQNRKDGRTPYRDAVLALEAQR